MLRAPSLSLVLGLACIAAPPLWAPPRAQGTAGASATPGAGLVPPAAAGQAGGPTARNPDPVVGSVEGHLIYLSDLAEASRSLPENLRNLPFETLYPVLLDRIVDHQALVLMALRTGLDQRRDVQRQVRQATDNILEGAYLGQVTGPRVNEAAIQALYTRLYANRPASEEVRARHILLTTEAEARKVLADLAQGADFATLARVVSKDPDAARGGDLGFFRREQVWPGFADVAFSLQPGQVAPNPVRNEFGWHVVKVEERRLVAPPSYADLHEQLRQQLLASAVQQAIAQARGQLAIHKFNMDGSEMDTTPRLEVRGGP